MSKSAGRRFSAALLLALANCHRIAAAAEPTPFCGQNSSLANPEAPSVASYKITAALEPERHIVTGTATIYWKNPSQRAVQELYLHAYLNAFAHPRTRFLRDGSAIRRSPTGLSTPGSLVISRITWREPGDIDLTPALAAHSPNDPDDATDLRLALPQAVAPGSPLTLDLEFLATLPELVERSGFSGTFYAVAQWFPKIARLDAAGNWRHFAYEPLAEFSSDFGNYDVTLDVPTDFTIAAPGVGLPEPSPSHRRRERYCLTALHDFAWFAWDRFVVSKEQAGSVEIRHYASRDQQENARATIDTLRWGLGFFGARLFPYPYSTLTVVHPPDDASAASGMEYPQLITTGGPWFLRYFGLNATQSVAIHELSHQWFYAAVASDEFLAPILDEGLASWAEAAALKARFGQGSRLSAGFCQLSEAPFRRVLSRRYARTGRLARAASDFGDFAAIAGNVYARFPTLLETIERIYGEERVASAISAYAKDFRFGHPEPEDFVSVLRTQLPSRATAAIATALFSDGWVDYGVKKLSFTWQPWANNYSNKILLERRGTIDLPVTLQVEFANGQVARRYVETVDSVTAVDWPYPSPIVAATLDPEHLVTIDDDLENQTLRVDEPPAPTRLALALHIIASTLWALLWP
jgi:hypothetical protein